MSVLTAEAVTKAYNGRQVVNGVNVEVRGGEVVGLLGPNGAGKTTTFHMMVGLIQPDAGKVVLNDQDLTGAPIYERARAGISYLPQESSVFRRLSVAENLFAILQTLDLSVAEQQERCQALMKMLGLSHLANNKAFTLSGGERRRVEIARALVLSPYFVLLDEPFTGVDPIAVAEIQKIIRRLVASGIGILITDHNVRETLGICDRAYILNDGVILEEGTPEKIASSPKAPKAKKFYLGEGFKF
jgi:lipopolysaccharide export system ATP-binding protein